MFEAAQYINSYSLVVNSRVKKEAESPDLYTSSLNENIIDSDKKSYEELNIPENNYFKNIGVVKQNPNQDSHDWNFAIVNYESYSESFNNHQETDYNTLAMKSIH